MEGSLRNVLKISTTSSSTQDSRRITLFINLQNPTHASSVHTRMPSHLQYLKMRRNLKRNEILQLSKNFVYLILQLLQILAFICFIKITRL